MPEVNLVFDVHGHQPTWVREVDDVKDFEKDFRNSRYRIYVNNDLIVERNWIWENNVFLRENIWVNSDSTEYYLKLEPVTYKPIQIRFSIKNLTVNSLPVDFNIEQLEISFKV